MRDKATETEGTQKSELRNLDFILWVIGKGF